MKQPQYLHIYKGKVLKGGQVYDRLFALHYLCNNNYLADINSFVQIISGSEVDFL